MRLRVYQLTEQANPNPCGTVMKVVKMMDEDRLDRVLPLMFRKVKIPLRAKEKLRHQLFGAAELTDDDMGYVAAAGDATEQKDDKKKEQDDPLKHSNKDN